MLRTIIIVSAVSLLAGCATDCSVGFKGPFYLHTRTDDLTCARQRHMNREQP